MTIKNIYIISLLTFAMCIFFENSSFSKIIEINKNFEKNYIGNSIEYFVDNKNALKINDILESSIEKNWKASLEEKPGFGFTKNTYWIRFTLKNMSREKLEFYLQQDYPQIDFIDLYFYKNSKLICNSTGDHYPFYQRPVRYRNFIFPIEIEVKEEKNIFMRYKTTGPMNIQLAVLSKQEFELVRENESIFFWIIYGIFLVMFFYNLIIFLSTRDRSYLYYILFITSISFFLMVMDGLAYQYLFPNNVWLGNYSIPISISFSVISFMLFTMSFLNTKENKILFHRILTFFLFTSCILLIVTIIFSYYYLTTMLLTILGGLSASFAFYTSIHLWFTKRSRQSAFFLGAFIIFNLGVVFLALGNLGIISTNFYVINGMKIGSVFQIVMLSFGLADKINIMQKDLEISRNELYQLNQKLESKVQDRTEELEKTNILLVKSTTEIAQTNEKLEEAMDEMKKINTKLKEKTKELDVAKREAERANLLKSKFLASMSHELRTPLNSIHGIIDLLQFGSYERDHLIVKEIQRAINLMKIHFNNYPENKEIKKIIDELFYFEKSLSNDGNVRRYMISQIKDKLYSNEFQLEEESINTINKIQELIDAEENDIFAAYRRIKKSGDYLLGLIDQVLNLSKIESGNIEIYKSKFLLHEFLDDIINDSKNYLNSKGKEKTIQLELSIDEPDSFEIYADSQKLRQILFNMISNAIKFTEKGKITLRTDKEDQTIKFSVIDTGKGIKENELSKLFNEFIRTEDSVGIEGTGLGLAISKKLIKMQDGEMGVESKFGEGSTFWFKLPC